MGTEASSEGPDRRGDTVSGAIKGLRVATAVVLWAALPAVATGVRTDAQTAEGLRLRNASSISIRVEIRVGQGTDCDSAKPIAIRTVAPGRFWVIRSSQPFCMRREGAAGGVATWLPWERKLPVQGRIDEVTL
jgi:hypothetical protein